MLFFVFFILSISFFFIVVNHNNKYSYVFLTYFIGIAALIFFSSMYVSKIQLYPYTFSLDYKIFLLLSRIRIPMASIYRMYILSWSIIFLAPIILCKLLPVSLSNRFFILSVISNVLFFIINDPNISWMCFYYQNTLSGIYLGIFNIFLFFKKLYSNFIMYFYIILPILFLIRYYRTNNLIILKKRTLVLTMCIVLIDIIILYLMSGSFFGSININNMDLTNFPKTAITYDNTIYPYVLILSAAITVIFVVILAFKPSNDYTVIKKKILARNMNLISDNINVILHKYKNAYIGLKSLGEITLNFINESNIQKSKETLNILIDTASEHHRSIQHLSNKLKDSTPNISLIDIKECIYSVVMQFNNSKKLDIKVYCETESTFILGDYEMLREVFVNLFQNSIHAIKQKENYGEINIVISEEDEYLIIDYTDNGIGIPDENIKNIFIPFYTTKSLLENTGLGLTYVERIIKAHNGDIEVSSKEMEWTKFRIIMPMIKKMKESNKHEKNQMGHL